MHEYQKHHGRRADAGEGPALPVGAGGMTDVMHDEVDALNRARLEEPLVGIDSAVCVGQLQSHPYGPGQAQEQGGHHGPEQ